MFFACPLWYLFQRKKDIITTFGTFRYYAIVIPCHCALNQFLHDLQLTLLPRKFTCCSPLIHIPIISGVLLFCTYVFCKNTYCKSTYVEKIFARFTATYFSESRQTKHTWLCRPISCFALLLLMSKFIAVKLSTFLQSRPGSITSIVKRVQFFYMHIGVQTFNVEGFSLLILVIFFCYDKDYLTVTKTEECK